MELHVLANLEGVLGSALGTGGYAAFAEITLKVGGVRRIARVHPDQQTVERPNRVNHAESGFLVTIVGWNFAAHHEAQGATLFGCGDSRGGSANCKCRNSESCYALFNQTGFHCESSSLL